MEAALPPELGVGSKSVRLEELFNHASHLRLRTGRQQGTALATLERQLILAKDQLPLQPLLLEMTHVGVAFELFRYFQAVFCCPAHSSTSVTSPS